MATIKELTVSKSDLVRVKPEDIHVKAGWNVREMTAEYEAYIDTLAQSISEIGVREALKCYMEDGVLFVSNGHSRLLACERAKTVYGAEIASVPVVMEDRYSSEADKTLPFRFVGWVGPETVSQPAASPDLLTAGKHLLVKLVDCYRIAGVNPNGCQAVRDFMIAAKAAEGRVTRQKLDGVERAKRGSKTTIKTIFGEVMKTAEENDEDELIHLSLTPDQYNAILRLLDL